MQPTVQQLWDPDQSKVHNMYDVRPEASRHIRNRGNVWKIKLMDFKQIV